MRQHVGHARRRGLVGLNGTAENIREQIVLEDRRGDATRCNPPFAHQHHLVGPGRRQVEIVQDHGHRQTVARLLAYLAPAPGSDVTGRGWRWARRAAKQRSAGAGVAQSSTGTARGRYAPAGARRRRARHRDGRENPSSATSLRASSARRRLCAGCWSKPGTEAPSFTTSSTVKGKDSVVDCGTIARRAAKLGGCERRETAPVEHHLAGGGLELAAEHLEQGRLAGPVGPDDSRDTTGLHGSKDIVQELASAPLHHNALGFQHRPTPTRRCRDAERDAETRERQWQP